MNQSQTANYHIIHHGLRRIVPIGFGIMTWLLLVLLGGLVLSADGISLGLLLIIGGYGILFLPIYRFRPWTAGLSSRVSRFVDKNSRALVIAGVLLVLVRIPVLVDQLSIIFTVLLLPLRIVPMGLFDAKLYYATALGDRVGQAVFTAGRLYVEVLWLYVVANLLVNLLPERIPWS